jgi:hypothetical protein
MKHRAPGLRTVSTNPTSVPEMLNWPNPAKIVRAQTRLLMHEKTRGFTLKADLGHVKLEGNDCDLHL